jgi:hypothetical protein
MSRTLHTYQTEIEEFSSDTIQYDIINKLQVRSLSTPSMQRESFKSSEKNTKLPIMVSANETPIKDNSKCIGSIG